VAGELLEHALHLRRTSTARSAYRCLSNCHTDIHTQCNAQPDADQQRYADAQRDAVHTSADDCANDRDPNAKYNAHHARPDTHADNSNTHLHGYANTSLDDAATFCHADGHSHLNPADGYSYFSSTDGYADLGAHYSANHYSHVGDYAIGHQPKPKTPT
jgi:hypothetical protein